MMKYSVLFALAFLAGLVWMFSDAVTPTTQEQPVVATVPVVEQQPFSSPVSPLSTERNVEEQLTEGNVSPAVGQVAAARQQDQGAAEPFTADMPYLPPEQRSEGNLGGPPPRGMMLTAPQEAY